MLRQINAKNSLLESENDFLELKDRELKDKKLKIKREIEQLFLKLIIVYVDGMNKFEKNNK